MLLSSLRQNQKNLTATSAITLLPDTHEVLYNIYRQTNFHIRQKLAKQI